MDREKPVNTINFDNLKILLEPMSIPCPWPWLARLDDPEETFYYCYGKDPIEALEKLVEELGGTWSDMQIEYDPVSDPDRLHDYPESFEVSNG